MKTSLIILAYNEEQFLGRCLDSAMKQIEKPDEIIIVDNNSTDDTVKIAKKYPVKIIQEKKQGMIFARNCGFNAATGDILTRCDSDTILPNDWIKKIKNNFEKQSISGLSGPAYYYDFPFFQHTTIFVKIYLWYVRQKLKGHNPLLGPNMSLTKKAWKIVANDVCLDDQKVHEDIDLSIHMMNKKLTIIYNPDLVVGMSGRRILHNPKSFFIEYGKRLSRTLKSHSL